MNDFGGAETGDILPFSDRTSTRIHDALWTLPMNDFEGNETDDILPFCTAGFTKTPNTTRSAALTHSYTPPGTSTQVLYNLAPTVHHNTLAEVHRTESPRPEKGDWSENDWIQEHALYGYHSNDSYTNQAEPTKPEDIGLGPALSRIPQKSRRQKTRDSSQAYTDTEGPICREEEAEEEFGAQDIHSKTLKPDNFNAVNDKTEDETIFLEDILKLEDIEFSNMSLCQLYVFKIKCIYFV
ncbi:uncharacterized protein [Salvelinus sp. IW2-2015]|uniref:uncharacterized protein n=1 Tax=Salvelinus sp. IW2-2015 TaxID=2691554 RepID=UPI0038D3D553